MTERILLKVSVLRLINLLIFLDRHLEQKKPPLRGFQNDTNKYYIRLFITTYPCNQMK